LKTVICAVGYKIVWYMLFISYFHSDTMSSGTLSTFKQKILIGMRKENERMRETKSARESWTSGHVSMHRMKRK